MVGTYTYFNSFGLQTRNIFVFVRARTPSYQV